MKNLVVLIGRIASDITTRDTANAQVATFSFVTDRPKICDGKAVKNAQGYTEKHSEFHRITVFGGLAKTLSQHKKKGDLLALEGRIHYSKWQDADGTDRYSAEIIAEQVDYL
jgi:single-strand DNA-binding protein